MPKHWLVMFLVFACLAGPAIGAEAPAASGDRVLARVNGQPITLSELQKPLVEGYGLKILLFQVQLSMARQKAAEQKVSYSRADVDAEIQRTLKLAFQDASKDDYPALLDQLLDRRNITRAEFDMVMETNAILRKIAEPQLKDRISEDNLKEAFNTVYGQTVVLRHIQCANPQEAVAAKMRVASGEKFEDVARTASRNARTAPLGGELPPFSRHSTTWSNGTGKIPESFKDWAFTAKPGDVSDPIQGEGAYHILKLEKKIEPKVVKFEDVKDSLRAELQQKLIEQGINELRNQLGLMARKSLVIDDPTLKAQFDARMAEQQKAIKEEDRIRQELRNKARAATQPSTGPSPATTKTPANPQGMPQSTGQSASPANAQAGERPPASKSAPAASPSATPAAPADAKPAK